MGAAWAARAPGEASAHALACCAGVVGAALPEAGLGRCLSSQMAAVDMFESSVWRLARAPFWPRPASQV